MESVSPVDSSGEKRCDVLDALSHVAVELSYWNRGYTAQML